jgi:S-adenosylmethionine hydrolase
MSSFGIQKRTQNRKTMKTIIESRGQIIYLDLFGNPILMVGKKGKLYLHEGGNALSMKDMAKLLGELNSVTMAKIHTGEYIIRDLRRYVPQNVKALGLGSYRNSISLKLLLR